MRVGALAATVLACCHAARAQKKAPSFEIGPLFSTYRAPDYLTTTQEELGARFTWNWFPHLALEAEYASTLSSPFAATNSEGGYFSQAFFGIKSGIRWKNWGLFAKARPGFLRYSSVLTGATTTSTTIAFTRGPLRVAAYDLGGGAEFFISRHFLFRYDLSGIILHEGTRMTTVNGQRQTFPSFTVKNNSETEVSVAFRF